MARNPCSGGGLPLADVGLPESQMVKLLEAHLSTTKDITDMKPSELSQATGLSLKESVDVLTLASNKQRPNFTNMLQMLQEERQLPKITTFCTALDAALRGGIPLQAITEVSAMPGLGRTQLCLQTCVSVQLPPSVGGLGGEALYVDTEGSFTVKRLREMASAAVSHIQATCGGADVSNFTVESILKGTHYFRCLNIVEVCAVIKKIPKLIKAHPKIRLIVIDSLCFHLRHDIPSIGDRAKLLRVVRKELIQPAMNHKMAVILTNHLTTHLQGNNPGELKPALGEVWGHAPTICLNLYLSGRRRVATITKAPHCRNASVYYQVTDGGLRDVSDNQTQSDEATYSLHA